MKSSGHMDRRHFLSTTSAVLLATACQSAPVPIAAKRRISKVGLQTYTLRDAMADDFDGTFQMIKDVGYDFVELNGRNFADRSPVELRRILDDVGLPAPATHVDYDSLANDPAKLADTVSILGCKFAILPYLSDDQRSLDDYKRHADMLNRSADAMKPAGVAVAYHNHQFEFLDLGDGQTGMDVLLSETDADLVAFELDMFWAALAQINIPALLTSNAGRFRLCHIKDMSGDPAALMASGDYGKIVNELMVNVGEGSLPFESYFALNDVSGMEYFIAEHDSPSKPYWDAIQTSYDAIHAMRF